MYSVAGGYLVHKERLWIFQLEYFSFRSLTLYWLKLYFGLATFNENKVKNRHSFYKNKMLWNYYVYQIFFQTYKLYG
jgi:hypothetical protein